MDNAFTGISNAEYHAHQAIGSTGLKRLKRSPLHYWTVSPFNPDRVADEPTLALRIGTAFHCAVFEPHRFSRCYGSLPDGFNRESTFGKAVLQLLQPGVSERVTPIPDGLSSRTKEGRQLRREIEQEGSIPMEESLYLAARDLADDLYGLEIFSADQMKMIRAMAANARALPESLILFGQPGAQAEVSIFVTDPLTGAPVKIRPDFSIPPGNPMFPNGLIVDGKSMEDASEEAFGRECWRWDMALQAALYCDVWQLHWGTSEPPVFLWLASEKEAPNCAKYYEATNDLLSYGRVTYRPLIETYARCLETGIWPGYPSGISPVRLPGWAAKTVSESIAA